MIAFFGFNRVLRTILSTKTVHKTHYKKTKGVAGWQCINAFWLLQTFQIKA